jgi:hypothetical protein
LKSEYSPQSGKEAYQAFENMEYALAARLYRELLGSSEADSFAQNGFVDSVTVQFCLKLTQCYLHLQSLKEAEWVLSQLWHPDGKYTIGATHPLFMETSRLHATLQEQLKRCQAIEKNVSTSIFFLLVSRDPVGKTS